MSWHTTAFFASLALWAVAVLFVAPETQEDVGSSGWRHRASTPPLLTWRSVLVTLFCAAIMSVGYCKLRLYLDEMSDALSAGRTGLNPYNIENAAKSAGFAFNSGNEVAVTRALLNCHDRATDFLTSYSTDMIKLEDKFRTSVRMLIEDIGSWNNEIAMIVREMRVVPPGPPTAPPPSSTAPALSAGSDQTRKGSISMDAVSNEDLAWTQRAASGTTSPSGAAPRGDSRGMLVTKNRRPNKNTSSSTSSTRGRKPTQVNVDEPDVYAAMRETPCPDALRSDGHVAGRNVRRVDPVRDNTILNVRRRNANMRDTDGSPPEPHTFDNPRPPAADNFRIEPEDTVGRRSSGGTTPSEADSTQLVPFGDELQKNSDQSPPKEDDCDSTPHNPKLQANDDDGDKTPAEVNLKGENEALDKNGAGQQAHKEH